jgi:hypothetical protein
MTKLVVVQAGANDSEAVVPAQTPANDGEAVVPAPAAANDNQPAAAAPVAANDNHPASPAHLASGGEFIRVIDDLPRPLPVMRGEAEIVRKLLGVRFREILFGKENS